ncbi:MAG: type II toxin-antitoxin system VapC family toxin [Egibacteraceae bacterium]
MSSDHLIDTDVFIDQLRGAAKLPATARGGCYSVITRCELLSGKRTDQATIDSLLGPLHELAVDRAIANRAGMLRRTVGIATPDALIAATALVHGLVVVTRNERHFARVSGLQVEPPS